MLSCSYVLCVRIMIVTLVSDLPTQRNPGGPWYPDPSPRDPGSRAVDSGFQTEWFHRNGSLGFHRNPWILNSIQPRNGFRIPHSGFRFLKLHIYCIPGSFTPGNLKLSFLWVQFFNFPIKYYISSMLNRPLVAINPFGYYM